MSAEENSSYKTTDAMNKEAETAAVTQVCTSLSFQL